MVIKYEDEPDDVWFIESVQDDGVSCRNWCTIKEDIGNYYSKIVRRKLKCDRSNERLYALSRFV